MLQVHLAMSLSTIGILGIRIPIAQRRNNIDGVHEGFDTLSGEFKTSCTFITLGNRLNNSTVKLIEAFKPF
jgi:hypothetical protein